jgi:hypothetical protein
MSKFYTLFVFLTLIFLTNACKAPFDEVDWNVKLTPEYAVPLVETTMNVRDLFDGFNGKAFLQIQPDGSFKMSSESQTIETQPLNLVALFTPQIIPITQNDVVISLPTTPGLNAMRIDAIGFKNGYFVWQFAPQPIRIKVKITVPQIIKDGTSLTTEFTLTNVAVRDSISLQGWTCLPTMGNIVMRYEATNTSGQSVSLDNQGSYELSRFEYTNMKGYFGVFPLPSPKDSVAIDFFKNWRPNGKITFAEPTITCDFSNSFGFPIRVLTTNADGTSQTGAKIALQSPLTSGIPISYPSLSELGDSKRTILTIDSRNSNIVSFLDSYPTMFSYAFTALSNIGNTNKTAGFITEDSKIKLSMKMEIPLLGTAENFTVLDTLVLDLSKFTEVTQAEFKLTTDNGLPLDMAFQTYFINVSGAVIDSLSKNMPLILRGAPTTPQGTTIGTSLAYNLFKISDTQFTNIRKTKKIIIKYTVSSTNNGANPVQINASQNFNIKLGVRVGVDL